MPATPYLACMLAVSQLYHLPPRVLPAIQMVEAGRPGSISSNTDGSADLGVMQVNTRWVPAVAAGLKLPTRVVTKRLIEEPCFNIVSAGAILRLYLDEAHGDVVRAVGYYHSHTPEHSGPYQMRVIQAAVTLFGRPPREPAHAKTAGPHARHGWVTKMTITEDLR